jgi:hypothetical protein
VKKTTQKLLAVTVVSLSVTWILLTDCASTAPPTEISKVQGVLPG